MPDNDQIEKIEVLRPHLETLFSTLDRALNKSMAEDLIDHYRNNRGHNPQQSILTAALQRSIERVAGYLEMDEA